MRLRAAGTGTDLNPGARWGRFRGIGLTVSVVSLILLLTGCGNDAERTKSGSPGRSGAEPVLACVLDYQPLKGPQAMASRSELVVRGRTGRPRPGLVQFRKNGKVARVETDIVPIRVTAVLADSSKLPRGDLPKVVEVQLCSISGTSDRSGQITEANQKMGFFDREAGLSAIEGREAVAYLTEQRGAGPGRIGYLKPARKPDPALMPASAEGFLIRSSSGTGVYGVQLGERFPGAGLDDFNPDRREFPPRKQQ